MPKEKTSPLAKPKRKRSPKPLAEQHKQKLQRAFTDIASGKSANQALKDANLRRETFYSLLAASAEMRTNYAHVKESQATAYADRLLDLADRVEAGTIDPQAARASADIIKWTVARILPHTYGDKVEISIDRKQSLADYALEHAKRVQVIEVD